MSANAILYRDFEIEENWLGLWEWTHKDYDGEGDNRHGHEATEAAAREAVDHYWSEQ